MFTAARHGTDHTALRAEQAGAVVTQGRDARADDRQRSISLTRDCIRIDRRVRGIAMRVAVPVRTYRGVALTLRSDAAGSLNYQLHLLHEDADLSVALDSAVDDSDIVADWRLWSRFFRLPALVERQAGIVEEADALLGKLTLGGQTVMRRPFRARFKRRPLFLQRRKPGYVVGEPVIHAGEREIVART